MPLSKRGEKHHVPVSPASSPSLTHMHTPHTPPSRLEPAFPPTTAPHPTPHTPPSRLEPAGSHGVWGLDDYQMLPFLWGASQLLAHPVIKPKSIHSAAVMEAHAHDYLYLAAVQFVKQVRWRWLHKKGGGAGLPLHPCPPSPPLLPGRSGLRFSEVQAPLRTQQRKNRRPFNVGYGAECGRAMRALLQTDAFQMCVWCGGGYASGAANRRPSNVSLVWGGYASAAANRRPSNVSLVWGGLWERCCKQTPFKRVFGVGGGLCERCCKQTPFKRVFGVWGAMGALLQTDALQTCVWCGRAMGALLQTDALQTCVWCGRAMGALLQTETLKIGAPKCFLH
eukprot:91033-Chlamydomonas_euryale.AAC.1